MESQHLDPIALTADDRLRNDFNDARNAITRLQAAHPDRRVSIGAAQDEADLLAIKSDITHACRELHVAGLPFLSFVERIAKDGNIRDITGSHEAAAVLGELSAALGMKIERADAEPAPAAGEDASTPPEVLDHADAMEDDHENAVIQSVKREGTRRRQFLVWGAWLRNNDMIAVVKESGVSRTRAYAFVKELKRMQDNDPDHYHRILMRLRPKPPARVVHLD